MVNEHTTQSVLDPTQELRVIRSHRRPKAPRSRTARIVSITLAVTISLGGLLPLSSEPGSGIAAVEASTASPAIAEAPRGSTVDRSARTASTRSQRIEKVIAFAYAQRGDRYSWGAAGPNRWDCSGLVSVAFKKGAGIRLPHYTGGIQQRGVRVSKKNLKRGDIIFPQHGHVGIYLGGGKMIHASSGKGKVIVAKVYGYYTARRVI